MSWTYSDYESQATDELRLTRLRLHIDEVNASMKASWSVYGRSETYDNMEKYARRLDDRRKELEPKVSSVSSTDPRVTSGFTRGRPL